jgi:hypothetical protein
LFGTGHETVLVCIFDAQIKNAAVLFGKQVIEQCGPDAADV